MNRIRKIFSSFSGAENFMNLLRIIPNFEVKFPKDELDKSTFQDILTVQLSKGKEIIISSIERQIAFKRYYLKSDKD